MVEDLAVPGHHTTGFIVLKVLLNECSKPKRNNTGRLALRGMQVSVVLILCLLSHHYILSFAESSKMIKSPSITNSMVRKSRKLMSFLRDGKRKTYLFGTDFISKVRVKNTQGQEG